MNESERLERWIFGSEDKREADDKLLAERIRLLLNHPKIDKYCLVDANYYDFSAIPEGIREKLNFSHDVYMIFGITTEGELASKWVGRHDLDSDSPIIDGKAIHPEWVPGDEYPHIMPAPFIQMFDRDLLSTPSSDLIVQMFVNKKIVP